MQIEVVKFFPDPFVEVAVDQDTGTKLLGLPFDHGGAGHTHYHVLSEAEFQRALTVDGAIKTIRGGAFYYSTFAPDNVPRR